MKANRISIILWTVNLASIAASVFSYVYLAYFVYAQTKLVLYSDLVLMAPMVVPVLFCMTINRVSGGMLPRKLLILANSTGIVFACITFLMISHFVVFALLGGLAIGLLDATQRVARIVAIKRYFSDADVKYAVPLTLTAQFIAGGIAGLIMSSFKGQMTPNIALLAIALLFVIAGLAAFFLPRDTENFKKTVVKNKKGKQNSLGTLKTLFSLLRENISLKHQFISFILFVSIFQGFFNVSRVALPTHVLHLSDQFVGLLQIISSMSALIGAIFFYFLNKKSFVINAVVARLICLISLCAMVASTLVHSILSSYLLYFIYMFLFEVLFFKYQADVVSACSKEHMPLIATFQYALAYIGMMIIIFVGGIVTQQFSLPWAAVICIALYLLIMIKELSQKNRLRNTSCDATGDEAVGN